MERVVNVSNKNNKQNNNKYYYLSLGMAFGLIIGTMLGVIFNNEIIGPGLGILLGMLVGFLIEFNKGNISKENLIQSIKIILIAVIGAIIISLIPVFFSYFV